VSQSDSELVMAVAQHRSKSAFAEIFSRYASKLKFFIIRLGADPNGADEVVQEAMLLVWRRAETFDPGKASLSTWLFTIARNKRISIVRKKQLPAPDPEDPAFEPSVEPMQERHIEASQQQTLIRGALDNLPPDQVEIIKMSFFEGKSHQAIAENLRIPLGTVKSRARLALGKLRKVVEGKTDGS
jgi:RNA polymerase sigma-70 factor (ECF subfamily)